ncbi:MAG: phosphoribosylamine--glycine ligase [Thermoplasmata archaeon]
MNILLIGGGARENIIGEKIVESGGNLYTVMGNLNPGLKNLSKEYLIEKETNIDKILNWEPVKNREVDIAIVGPEAPLELGIVEKLDTLGIETASPNSVAAEIETNKKFMREIMEKYNIPGNLRYYYFTEIASVKRFIKNIDFPFVIKPVGLTGGKGVWVQGDHFQTKEEAIDYCERIIKENIGGGKGVLIEEKIEGEEYSLQAFTDGKNLIPMPLVQDFKRAYEGDKGPNTGGMGSYSMSNHLLPFITIDDYNFSLNILQQIIDALRKEGRYYKGVIYGQFMITKTGPKIVEINARFGDPEAMNVLSLLKGNFVDIISDMARGRLRQNFYFEHLSTLVKYIVPIGYGTNPKENQEINIDINKIRETGARVYFGSVNAVDNKILTTHSRSIAIVTKAEDLSSAYTISEKALRYVSGNIYVRHDIGHPELIERKINRMRSLRSM